MHGNCMHIIVFQLCLLAKIFLFEPMFPTSSRSPRQIISSSNWQKGLKYHNFIRTYQVLLHLADILKCCFPNKHISCRSRRRLWKEMNNRLCVASGINLVELWQRKKETEDEQPFNAVWSWRANGHRGFKATLNIKSVIK